MSVLYLLDFYFANGYNLYHDINLGNITGGQYGAANYEIFSCRGKGRKYNPRGRTASRHPAYSLQAVKST